MRKVKANEENDSLDFSKVKTIPLATRACKVTREHYTARAARARSFEEFLSGLPGQLKAEDLKALVRIWVESLRNHKPVIALCGAHVLKVGLSPLFIQGMQEGWLSAIAFNGAGAVHDFELAWQGATSEDVAKGLEDGTFGMAEETGRHLNAAAVRAQKEDLGFGRALAKEIEKSKAVYPGESVVVQGARVGVPVTIHVAIGTDIVHQHPSVDAAAIGAATYKDFQILANVVAGMKGGGLVLNFGSAVILPEVFLKALTVVRNLKDGVEGFSAADFDMIPQYRPKLNVVERPTQGQARGFRFTGHHELMIPLLFQALAEEMAGG
jgi:hypothetical protein